jgi:uncharacterized membrane protein YkoI
MSQRIALILSAGLTAFVLVVAGAVVGRYTMQQQSAADATTQATSDPAVTQAPADAAAAATPTTDIQVYQQREAEYQALIAQANQRLEQAYSQMNSQTASQSATPSVTSITPDMAVTIALKAVPGATLIGQPQLLTYQNKLAYQVTLNRGLVYVDANSGQILSNSAKVQIASAGGGHSEKAGRSDNSGGGSQNQGGGGEHESNGGGGGGGEAGDH